MFKHSVYDIAMSRRTIQTFDKSKEVSDELVKMAIEAALRAPNHKMTFPWGFVEIGPDMRDQFANMAVEAKKHFDKRPVTEAKAAFEYERFSTAPKLFIVTQRLHENELRRQEDYAAVACGIENFSLVMWENGVGVKWSTMPVISYEKTYPLLGINPEEERMVGILLVGYPDAVPETKRPSFEDVFRKVG